MEWWREFAEKHSSVRADFVLIGILRCCRLSAAMACGRTVRDEVFSWALFENKCKPFCVPSQAIRVDLSRQAADSFEQTSAESRR